MFGTGMMALRRTSSGTGLMSSRRLLSRGGATTNPPRMAGEHYDYLVIGGGSGGVASARRAATYDAKASGEIGPWRMFPANHHVRQHMLCVVSVLTAVLLLAITGCSHRG